MAVDDNATYGLKGSQIKKIVNEIDSKQDTLTAGTNVDISNNVISATDTTYSAGTGLDLTGTAFSVDSTIATKSEIPTKTSDITNDGSDGTSTYVEADELATVATSGSYNDLLNKPTIPAAQVNSDWNATSGVAEILNKPTIPVVNNATLTIQKNSTSVGTFTANASSNKTINITVPTTAADVSALPDSTKYGAYFVASINTTTYVMTMTLKDQDGNTLGTAQTIDLPLESVVVNGSYDSSTKEVVLTLQGGSTIRFSVADLVSGLQTEITSSNKLSADLVDDSTTTNKFVTASDKTTWNAKQNALTAGSNIQINGSTISATDTTYSNYTGATSQTAGTAGLVPAPAAGDETKFLSGNGQWTTVSQYSLPIATANDLGGIKVGANLSIDPSTGVLSADAQQVTLYSSTGQNTDGAMTQKATTDALGLKADASSLATVATSGSYDDLTNKPSIPAAQVQSNWTQSDNTKVDYIKNKPSLATVATSGSYNDLSNKPTIPTVNNATLTIQKNGTTVKTFTANASSNVTANITVPTKTSDLTNDGADNTSTYVEADELAAVATSGSYNDLSNKPTIPAAQIQSDWTQTTTTAKDYIKNKPNLATVATSGSYNDLSNKPTIPTVNNATLTIQKNGTTVKTFTANASSNVTANITVPTKTSDITNDSNFVASGDLATVATSGSYNDLSNKPTIPAAQVQSNWTQTTTTAVDYIKNKPTLAAVATSGSYNDLSNKPTIPTVNNATLTIQKNGTTVQTFTANSSENKTVNITVPTNNNQLTNGAGYQTAANVQSAISGKADSATTLAGYGITDAYTKSQVDTALSAKQGTLTAGAGITITNNIVAQTIPTYYGTCGTWAADRAKNVDCAGFVLQDGARVLVNFEHQAGDSLSMNIRTLNVNNTGAKTIVGPGLMEGFKGEPLWEDHQLVEFRYDATNEKWVIIGHGFASTSDYGITKLYDGIASTSTKMAATANAVKTAYDMAAKRIGVTLYDNSTGAYSGITLSDSVDNYSYIEIYFKTNDGYQGYKKCIGGATFDTDLYGMQCNSGAGAMYYKASIFTFNGTSVELKAANRSVEAGIIKNQYPTVTAANYLLITRVVGIKP